MILSLCISKIARILVIKSIKFYFGSKFSLKITNANKRYY